MFGDKIILWVMAAAAVPILLHLLNLQKVRRMEFSTLMFLKEIQKSRFRKLRIKRFLLMLVRAAIVVFLVFAFADPFLRGYTGKGSNTRKLGVLYIDSSFSMLNNGKNDSTSFYSDAEKIAERIKNLYSSSDELITFKTSVQSDTLSRDIQVKPSLNSILSKTNEILKEKNYNESEIFIISDLQRVNFNELRTQTNSYSRIYFVDAARGKQPSISINSLEMVSKIAGLSFPAKLRATVSNFTDNFLTDEKIRLYNDDILLEEKYLDLKPRETKHVEFIFEPKIKGYQTIKAELINNQPDAFAEDNVVYKRIYIPEKINAGIVSDSPEKSKYIKAVFDAGNKNVTGEKVYNYEESTSFADIFQSDAIYVCGREGFSEKDLEDINKFVESGKRLLIFPPENMNPGEYDKLTDFKITSIEKPNTEATINKINTEAEIFQGIFKTNNEAGTSSEKFRIDSYYRIVASNTTSELLSMSVGNTNASLLLSAKADKLVIAAVSADLKMSAFPTHSLFAPFILRSAYTFNSSYLSEFLPLAERDTLESNPELISEEELVRVLDNAGIERYEIIPSSRIRELEKTVEENRTGRSLWMVPLVLALLLVPIEMFLSSRRRNV